MAGRQWAYNVIQHPENQVSDAIRQNPLYYYIPCFRFRRTAVRNDFKDGLPELMVAFFSRQVIVCGQVGIQCHAKIFNYNSG